MTLFFVLPSVGRAAKLGTKRPGKTVYQEVLTKGARGSLLPPARTRLMAAISAEEVVAAERSGERELLVGEPRPV